MDNSVGDEFVRPGMLIPKFKVGDFVRHRCNLCNGFDFKIAYTYLNSTTYVKDFNVGYYEYQPTGADWDGLHTSTWINERTLQLITNDPSPTDPDLGGSIPSSGWYAYNVPQPANSPPIQGSPTGVEPTAPPEQKCICSIQDLMYRGCKCGQLERDKVSSKNN